MNGDPDIVVVGAGSNSLVSAAYLAKAGKKVLVLEKNDQCGGGVVSIEIAPGFINDTHASGYYLCIASPTVQHDELELMSKHGLEWKTWDAGFATIFDSGDGLVAYSDLDRTCQDIARYSQKDAERYRDFAQECIEILPLLSNGSATPPLPTGAFISMLEESYRGCRLVDMMFQSAYDILDNLFESTEVRIHMMKWVAEAMEGPEVKGTGAMLVGLFGLAHTHKAHIPVGGSRAVSNALIRCIQHHGGEVRTESEVVKVNISAGEARGVTLASGETINARAAVLGCIHPHMLEQMIPEVDKKLAAAAKKVRLSNHGALNQQIALSEWPEFKAGQDERWSEALCIEYVRKDELAVRKVFDQYRYGEIPTHLSPLTIMNSRKDPSRAPSRDHCALYLYHFAPRDLQDGGLQGWEKYRQSYADAIWEEYKSYTTNIDDSKVIARHIESPLEHHNHSASFSHGDIFGIGTTMGQNMGRRPIPELAQFRIPGIDKLYLVGPFMHPGGTVNFGGRATAMRMMMDWKMDLSQAFAI
ncbi:Phytoene dehydrogenase-related protein [Marinobacter sp. es.048]|uniref:phytoene desaturase family protein n=1 Tax=Marinobacter sp. es.048 TaxID=1761795 RepID=UPI000B595754|nr:NAD(P)/FAD-dependent oxidoreductase [Marinobacter sp. es.048]SNC62722.1 Phytoene dehydrogenase-related protein [Marinobacter sp. es.048]